MKRLSRISTVLPLLMITCYCSQGPTKTISGVQDGRSDAVKASEDDGQASTTVAGQDSVVQEVSGNQPAPDASPPVTRETDCLGNEFEDSTGIALATQQKTLIHNGIETSLCNLIRIEQGSASILHYIPSPCEQDCLDTAINLGLAHQRSSLNSHLTLIYIFNSQNQEASSSLISALNGFGLKPVTALDSEGQTGKNLAVVHASLLTPEFMTISPALFFNSIPDSSTLYLEIVTIVVQIENLDFQTAKIFS